MCTAFVAANMVWSSLAFSEPSFGKQIANVKIASDQTSLNTPLPEKWLESKGRECNGKGRYRRFCQGPRRAPLPYGDAATLAKRLGFGEVNTVSHLMLQPPSPEWVLASGLFMDDVDKKLLWPVVGGKRWRGYGRIGKPIGKNKKRRLHKGIDIGAPEGTPFRAAKKGIVAYSDNGITGYGNMMVVIHPDASVAFYAHAKALYLFPGQLVKRGQILGEVGHSGYARGTHLHFEYRIKGWPRDPEKYF